MTAMTDRDTELSQVLDEAGLSLEDLCRVGGVAPQWVVERVQSGLLVTRTGEPAAWRFDTLAVRRVRCMARLERDFDAVPELAALVADLLEELESMRAQLGRAGFD
jgi:chaperone modulatory protein CbpM